MTRRGPSSTKWAIATTTRTAGSQRKRRPVAHRTSCSATAMTRTVSMGRIQQSYHILASAFVGIALWDAGGRGAGRLGTEWAALLAGEIIIKGRATQGF